MTDAAARLTAALADRYRIQRELGQGGMATVYLAQDVKHGRNVALKILRPELAAVIGGERFLAEIRTTANLQHPHILPLHDSGEAGGMVYYVMPYIEGESLRHRLNREKQLPIEDAVRITREVAAALDYAHRQGVIHRDIKPENILLHDGSALVADFGIALAVSRSEGGSRMTETGMSLGTPHYMSPEQAMGERELSPRSDVYALGCVLYEMLVGEPPFTGPTPQAIVAKVITEKPPNAATARESVPRNVARAIQKSLAKLPADRFGSAAEMSAALVRAGPVEPDETDSAPGTPHRTTNWLATTGLGAVALLAVMLAAWGWLRPGPARRVRTTYVTFAAKEAPPPGPWAGDLSRDGSMLVYAGPLEEGVQRLWLKRRDELHGTPLPGTEGAAFPFFSPDGLWVAFFANGKLKKISVRGGAAVPLAEAPTAYKWGGWLRDGRIVFAGPGFSLLVVGEAGGRAELLVGQDQIQGGAAVGAVPLGNRGVLFANCGVACATSDLWVYDLKTKTTKKLIDNGLWGGYLKTGHLLYHTGTGTLFAAPFDLATLSLKGPGVPVVEGLARFAVWVPADDGTLLYQEGEAGTIGRPVWVTRGGQQTPIDPTWSAEITSLALSPDGKRLAVTISAERKSDIWIKQLDRGPLTRVTFGEQESSRPAWSADGKSILYIRGANVQGQVMSQRADGTGQGTVLADSGKMVWAAVQASSDGEWLVLRSFNASTSRDIYAKRLTGDTAAQPLATSPVDEVSPNLSPNGKWLAYVSTESGRQEVFVRPFPNAADARYQVSVRGGSEPIWAHNGRELFFFDDAGQLIAAKITTSPAFVVESQKALFSTLRYSRDDLHSQYAVSPDDQRFVMIELTAFGAGGLVLVDNWFDVLREKLKH